MNRFDSTVQKLRGQPEKLALLRQTGLPVGKTAGWKDNLSEFGQRAKGTVNAVGDSATKYLREAAGTDMAKEFGRGVAGAAAVGMTGYLGGRLMSGNETDSSRNDARYKELGKLEAQSQHRQGQLKRLSPLHTAMLGQVSGSDDVLSKADPQLLQSSYDTMRRFAPTLATDPNATRAFLQEVATYGKPPSYATLKLLADTEGSVMKTYGGYGNE